MKKEFIALAALALCCATLVNPISGHADNDAAPDDATRIAAAPAAKPPTGGVAATVNSDKIMLSDLNRMVDAVRNSQPELNADAPEAKAALAKIRSQILDNLIERRLLVQEAHRRNLVATPDAIATALSTLRGGMTETDYNKSLAQEGRTIADVRLFVTEELIVRELTTRLTGDIIVPDDEVKTFYDANPDEWAIPEGVRAHHILIAFGTKAGDAPTDQQKAAAKTRALDVLKRLRVKGADFAVIAAKYSDSASKQNGGQVEIMLNQWEPPLVKAVQAAKDGDLIGPIEVANGYSIARIDEKIPASTVKFEQVRDNVKLYLLQQKIQARLQTQVQALRSTATIKKYI